MYPGDPQHYQQDESDSEIEDEDDDESADYSLMTREDWSNLVDGEKKALYCEYEAERWISHFGKDRLISKVKHAAERLPNLSEFIHTPVIRDKCRWSAR